MLRCWKWERFKILILQFMAIVLFFCCRRRCRCRRRLFMGKSYLQKDSMILYYEVWMEWTQQRQQEKAVKKDKGWKKVLIAFGNPIFFFWSFVFFERFFWDRHSILTAQVEWTELRARTRTTMDISKVVG